MQFKEIMAMALSSLGANKLRAALTMIGITIGVFSIILVMTAIGALQSSIESGISFLGSNVFQFAKYPVNIDAGGANVKKKYQNRRNITYQQAQRYYELMQGNASEICLKCFGRDLKGQAVYNGVKTPPSLTVVGTNRGFLTANAFTLGYGRNLNDEDVALARNVAVIGKGIEKRLFPHESPIGKVIRMSGHTYSRCWCPRGKGYLLWGKPGRFFSHADHPVFRELRRSQPHGEHRDAAVFDGTLQPDFG